METSPHCTRMRFKTSRAVSFHTRGSTSINMYKTSGAGSIAGAWTAENSFREEFVGSKRPLVANLPNVPTVKIGSYSKRNPDKLFYL